MRRTCTSRLGNTRTRSCLGCLMWLVVLKKMMLREGKKRANPTAKKEIALIQIVLFKKIKP